MVRMRHDGIEQEIEVLEISVPVYERSGWTVVSDQPVVAPTAKGRRRSETEGEN
jgi:hypothetical protein